MDGRRRAEFQQEQSLYGQRASLLLVKTDLGYKHTIERGLNIWEVLVLECLEPVKPPEHAYK